MRRLFFSGFFIPSAAVLIATACGDSAFSGNVENESDGSVSDATFAADTGLTTDGSIGSDASVDGEAGATCTGRWCTCGSAKSAIFCDDFDRSGERLADNWSYDASFASTDGGHVKLSDAAAESPPSSMYATAVADNFHKITAALTEDVSVKPTTIAFDLLLSTAGANCSGQTIDFAQLGVDTNISDSPSLAVRFSAVNGVPELGFFTGSQVRIDGDASLPSTWTRIRLTTELVALDGGGNSVVASIYVTPGGSDDTLDASVLLSGSTRVFSGTNVSWLSIGVLNAENATGCDVYIDNVAIYQ